MHFAIVKKVERRKGQEQEQKVNHIHKKFIKFFHLQNLILKFIINKKKTTKQKEKERKKVKENQLISNFSSTLSETFCFLFSKQGF